eukprot:353901_1
MTDETDDHESILMTTNKRVSIINTENDGMMVEQNISDAINDESILKQIRGVLKYKAYRPLLFLIFLYIAAGYMPTVFMSAYGAEWFAKQNCSDDDCPFDYATWTFYSSLFLSLRGVIAFLFASYIGRLSDAYGRKRFIYMHIITSVLPTLPLLFWYNMWPYFTLYLFGGLNGSNNSATPIMISYISDIIPSKHRTMAFGLMYIMGGLGLFIGAISAIIISIIWNDYVNFIIVTLLYAFQCIYCWKFMDESLTVSNRKPIGTNIEDKFNPFRPLMRIKHHPIVFVCCIISFLISLPETGVLDTAIPYMLDQLEVKDNKVMANTITGTFILLVGLGMIISNVVLLPILKRKYNDYEISIIGSIIVTISMFLFACISWIPHIITVCITAIVLSFGFIVFPSIYSIVTKYLSPQEQGIGMGIIFACRGLTYAIAPFTFGYAYTAFKSIGFPSFPYLLATIICASAIWVIKYKLKRTMQLVDLAPDSYCLSMSDLSQQQQDSMMNKRNNAFTIYKEHEHSGMYHNISNFSSEEDNHL